MFMTLTLQLSKETLDKFLNSYKPKRAPKKEPLKIQIPLNFKMKLVNLC